MSGTYLFAVVRRAAGGAMTDTGASASGPAAESFEDRVSYELGRLPQSIASAVVRYLAHRDPGESGELAGAVLGADEDLTLRELAVLAARLDAHFEVAMVPNTPADPQSLAATR